DNVIVKLEFGRKKQPLYWAEFDTDNKQTSKDYLKLWKQQAGSSQVEYFTEIINEKEDNPLYTKDTVYDGAPRPFTGLLDNSKAYGDYPKLESPLAIIPFSVLHSKRKWELQFDFECVSDNAVYDEEGNLDNDQEPVRGVIFYVFIRRTATWNDDTDWYYLRKDLVPLQARDNNLYQWSPQINWVGINVNEVSGIYFHNFRNFKQSSIQTTRFVVNERKTFKLDVEFADDFTGGVIGGDDFANGPGEIRIHVRQPNNCELKLYSIKFAPKQKIPSSDIARMPQSLATTKLRTYNKNTILGSAPIISNSTNTRSIRGTSIRGLISYQYVTETIRETDSDAAVFRRGIFYQQDDTGSYEASLFNTPINSKLKLNEILRDWYYQDKKDPKQKLEGVLIGNLSPMNFVNETITQHEKFHILKLTKSDRSDENRVTLYAFTTSLPETEEIPSTIDDLKVTENSYDYIKIKWSAPDSDGGAPIQIYRIYRSEDDGITFILINSISSSIQNWYDDSIFDLNTRYLYYVTSLSSVGESGNSNMVSVTTLENDIKQPTNLLATTLDSTSVKLEWIAGEGTIINPLLGYNLYREDYEPQTETTATTSKRKIGDVQFILTETVDFSVLEDSRYIYWLTSYNKVGESEDSNNTETVTLKTTPTVPAK
ncbi:MAG: fibronectin type III domain-containing protein, partial [Candidatus Heimdallarchaeota archaeon]